MCLRMSAPQTPHGGALNIRITSHALRVFEGRCYDLHKNPYPTRPPDSYFCEDFKWDLFRALQDFYGIKINDIAADTFCHIKFHKWFG